MPTALSLMWTDRQDAQLILRLMLEDRLPQIWVASWENRDLRQLLWHRHRMVQARTRIMNQLQAVALNEGLRCKKRLWREAGRAQLEAFPLAPWASRRRHDLLELLDRLNPTITDLTQTIEQEVEKCPEAHRLMTHPGVGPLTALAFVLIMGRVDRFQCGKQIATIFYLQTGKVRLTVVSKTGKEATIGVLSEGSFFGEGSLAGQTLRMGTAIAMTDCAVLRIEKKAVVDTLHREHTLSDLFVAYLLTRNIRYEEDLVDQLFNSSEKRLARVLLMLAHFGKEAIPETVVPKISQETLAEMIGTTRSRVSFFMNRFRKLGFIQYAGGVDGGLQVHSSLLNVVLHD